MFLFYLWEVCRLNDVDCFFKSLYRAGLLECKMLHNVFFVILEVGNLLNDVRLSSFFSPIFTVFCVKKNKERYCKYAAIVVTFSIGNVQWSSGRISSVVFIKTDWNSFKSTQHELTSFRRLGKISFHCEVLICFCLILTDNCYTPWKYFFNVRRSYLRAKLSIIDGLVLRAGRVVGLLHLFYLSCLGDGLILAIKQFRVFCCLQQIENMDKNLLTLPDRFPLIKTASL